MPSGKLLTRDEKIKIDAYHEAGKSNQWIANKLGRSKGAIGGYLTGYRNHGQKKSSGRPKKLTARDERQIGRKISNTTKSAADIKRELKLNVTSRTVLNAIHRLPNIVRAKMMKVPKLKDVHKQARLTFARQYMTQDWNKVSLRSFHIYSKIQFLGHFQRREEIQP